MLFTPETMAVAGRVNTLVLEARAPMIQAPEARLLGLTQGQIINAIAEVRGERLKLILQGRPIDLPRGLRLQAGDTVVLKAQVQSTGQWQLQPQSINGKPVTLAPASQPTPPVQSHAQPLQPLAQPDLAVSTRLSALLSRPPDTAGWAHLFKSGALGQLLTRLVNPTAVTVADERFDQWPLLNLRMASLTPKTLRDAMLASGLSAEALLARGDQKGGKDVKSLLRQLMAVLNQGTNAHAVVKDAFDDIERAQVDAAQALERRELAFSLVLPFVDADPINLKFQRHAKRDETPGSVYTVDVHTQNKQLGELWMRSQIHIQPQQTDVALTMWAVRADVAAQARAHIDDLRDELDAAGLGLLDVQIFNAARPSQDSAWTTPDAGAVLDVSA